MSGLTALLDTLLATRLAQRVDLVPLKSELEIAGLGAVTRVEEVANDVRLTSRAALEQQLGVGLLKRDQRGQGNAPARADETVTLSMTARAVNAILDGQTGVTSKIIGSKPLLPQSQPPLPHLLAATLARTVANSGLFYESHLAQFVAGTRTLAELTQEPQARLNSSLPNSVLRDGVRNPNPDQLARSSERDYLDKTADESIQDVDGQEPALQSHGTNTTDVARSNAYGLNGIHPEAVLLVRQQLELLAVPVFRWGGEAWPGVPMDWEIHEKGRVGHKEERQAAARNKVVPRTWSTRLALMLPTLKDVEVHVSLAGATLQIHFAARESATRALLSECCAELPKRFQKLGLQLIGLQIGSLPVASEAQEISKDGGACNTSGVGRADDRPSAIALSHANKNREPIVVARGYGDVAYLIVQRAHENDLYVHELPDLVKLLMHADLDDDIPTQLYVAIAEVLAWLYRLEHAEPFIIKKTSI